MSIQDKPAALDHLEIQLTALLKRSMQDDVPADVTRQILDAHAKLMELATVLTAETPKKKWFNRK